MSCPYCETQTAGTGRFCTRCGSEIIRTARDDAKPKGGPQVGAGGKASDQPSNAGTNKADLIGRVLEDKYQIEAKLGEGGMGAVYLAKRLHIGDSVAIKVLHPQLAADREAVERFRREVRATARLKHPNAVAIHDFGVSSDNLPYLVMELVEGESLRKIIKRQGPLTQSVAGEILSQICAALDEAHRLNIIHRDIKPDNIIITTTTSGLRVKVLDFGIAKLCDNSAASSLTQTGAVVGTPHYMSPEQCMGEELDGRADIYSLGVTLFEMLSGAVPFNSPTPMAVVVQHITQPPPPLRLINITVSPAVEAVVLRALEKRREARPQTAGEMAREFVEAIQGAPSHQAIYTYPVPEHNNASGTAGAGYFQKEQMATPSTPGQFMTPPSLSSFPATPRASARRNVIPWLIGAVVLMVIVAGATVWLLRSKSPQSQSPQSQGGEEQKKVPAPPTAPPGMAYVPGGEFLMGSDQGEVPERPPHKQAVTPFFIDLNEVTNHEYEEFIEETDRRAPSSWHRGHHPEGGGDLPVTGISWEDASEYAKWAGKRLPTEQEWEFAARGNDGRRYPWGNDWNKNVANAHTSSHGRVERVGEHTLGQSPFGAIDMIGNVWEWTASDFTAYPSGELPPQTASGLKVIRGGGWSSDSKEATATFRKGSSPRGGKDIGFRCVKDVEPR